MKLIETERLFLEEANLDDESFIFALLNSPNWLEFIGDRGIRSLDDARAYIEDSLIASYKANGFGLYKVALKKAGKPIGVCGLLKRKQLAHPDIGFAFLPDYEGKGYGFEAANATMIYAKSALNIMTVLAITDEKNLRSQRLLQKIGLELEGNTFFEGKGVLLFSTAPNKTDF